ncbi:MAG: RNA polymerase sigma-54 factor [Steroidobacteraceae bacterium]|nr:RNA polymerase sigma-54 factor [Steroidobacteraceae bacterium]
MLKPSLQLKLGQSLTMTPQLQQAIRLLQLPALELQAHVRELLESNVMLEAVEETEQTGIFEAIQSPAEREARLEMAQHEAPQVDVEIVTEQWSSEPSGPSEAPWAPDDDDRAQEYAEPAEASLQDHLLSQLEVADLDARRLAIARAIVDAINDDGYLIETAGEIAATLRPDVVCTEGEVLEVLATVQALDPAGIGARSVAECITLQLRQLDGATPGIATALAIATDHLDAVARGEHALLRRELRVSDEELAAALALVRTCRPRPGTVVSGASPEYVVPDVHVRRTDRGWSVEINPATLPRVRLNQGYASLLGRSNSHATLRAQLQEARWLLKSLEIRNETLLKVARAIVERQSAFLEQGDEHMRPMILKDIAAAIEMHESTISRITSGKFMHTPRGVFELRYFFSSHVGGGEAAETSSTAIRAKIRKLVRDEDPAAPLSDSRIAELLSAEGIPVARRTVAKYREAMRIAPSNERRRSAPK